MSELGIDAMGLIRAVEQMSGTEFGIGKGDMASVRLEAVHSLAKAEAL